MRVLLVARKGEARDVFEAALQRLGVPYDSVTAFSEVKAVAEEKEYSGLLLDILTLVRARKEEKVVAYDFINYFPSARIKWNAATGRLNLFYFDAEVDESENALETFIEQRCLNVPMRKIRKFIRKGIILNTRLGRDAGTVAETGQRTFTTNISQGGVFVHTLEPFANGEILWLRFDELFDQVPVRVEVRWRQEWGERRAIPGVGLQFVQLNEAQAEELLHFLKGD